MTDDRALVASAALRVVHAFAAASRTIATAESCTGGLIAAALTDVPGSSSVLDRGFVTYSNAAKTEMIAVPSALIEAHGAVSREVALAMAEGARLASRADFAVAVTGIAGPGGGSPAKPVGLVHLAVSDGGGTAHRVMRYGDLGRDKIRRATVATALAMLEERLALQLAAGTP